MRTDFLGEYARRSWNAEFPDGNRIGSVHQPRIQKAEILTSGPSKDRRNRNKLPCGSIAASGNSLLQVNPNYDCDPAIPQATKPVIVTSVNDFSATPETTSITELRSVADIFVAAEIPQSPDRHAAESLEKLQYDVLQKDELISALVNELEQAVEQLDRFHRTGSAVSRNGGASASNDAQSALSVAQSPVLDDVRRLVDHLEQSRPDNALARIEAQLASVYDLVSDLRQSGGSIAMHDGGSTHDDSANEEIDRAGGISSGTSEPENQLSSWESIKSKMLSETSSALTAESRNEESEFLKLISETPTPGCVDFDSAGLDALKSAISERDAYIIQLNRLFRTRNNFAVPADWASLANVPADLQLRVESMIERLDVQVRLGEVEMSLERARLARERSQIQSEREQLEKHLKRLGLSSIADLDNISAATGTAGDRRWMRFLGPGSK